MSEQRRVAAVTGAGSGIGAAIAAELAARDHAVVVTDLDSEAAALTAERIGAAAWRQLDVTDRAAVEAAVAATVAEQGGLDAWVSNAGVSQMTPFLEVAEEVLDRTLAVNLKGVFLCGQAAARAMRERGGGVIVNLASMAGKQGRVPYLSDYVASKFGVVGLTQAMAFELAPHGIRVNSVCPGYVRTPMQERELAWEARLRGVEPADVERLWVQDTPLGRLERPEDVARVVAFLVAEDAAFVTGEAVAVNGGAFMD
ncbi:MAG TPA: glucose 1-dehydrogenase [Solirubrobacterales bacterium]|jgi:NAD(P)-dependent dehydrogenase (short-subunit alcohol dehydrogenase family)